MFKLLELTSKLYLAIRAEKWDKAKKITDEIKIILSTYDSAC